MIMAFGAAKVKLSLKKRLRDYGRTIQDGAALAGRKESA